MRRESPAPQEPAIPAHDWTRVDDDTFHVFHNTWLTRLYDALKGGLMPPDHYAAQESAARFAGKVVSAVEAGVHVLVVDLHPPTARDPDGMPGEIGAELGDETPLDPAGVQGNGALTAASYVADDPPVADVQPFAVGDPVPDMPLFLDPGHYVTVPLGATYGENFARLPAKFRRMLEE